MRQKPRQSSFPSAVAGRIFAICTAVCSSVVVVATTAHGYSEGIATASGKQVLTCNGCHYGGIEPEARFEGPTFVRAGMAATFRFVVKTRADDQSLAGFNVAASAGALDIAPETGGHVEGADIGHDAELTHSYPQLVDQNLEAAWEFTWTAPEEIGNEILYGAGNTVNGDGMPTGDRGAAVTWVVAVIDPNGSPPPTATPTPTPPPKPCRGDCRHDGVVTVDELVMGVTIALQRLPLDACPDLDTNDDDLVTVDELVAAIENAVGGCP